MKSLVFDTSPIISIVTNNLLWVLQELKKRFEGEFLIPEAVKREVIDTPLKSKKFKLEAMQLLSFITAGNLRIYQPPNPKKFQEHSLSLLNLANKMFVSHGSHIQIVHLAEIEAIALAKELNADACVVDERTLRVIIEDPPKLAELLSRKLHTHIDINEDVMKLFKKATQGINIIRSTELMATAYDLGILEEYMARDGVLIKHLNPRRTLLEGLLWGLKLRGCSISQDEINDIMKLEGF